MTWPERLRVVADSSAGVRSFDVTIGAASTDVPTARGLPRPKWILPTGAGLGYGYFDLDPMTLEALTTGLSSIADPLTRGAALVTLWESMLEGKVDAGAPDRDHGHGPAARDRRADPQQLLDYTQRAFWRFTQADDRAATGAELEAVFKAGLASAKTTSAKAAWFDALRSVATTPATVAWLERVWRREIKVPGLPLAETDEASLALDLAVRDVSNADAILKTPAGTLHESRPQGAVRLRHARALARRRRARAVLRQSL